MAPGSATQEPSQEIRLAIVMYGGVSLAIYINGVTQELLRLVRSTALPLGSLRGSERVYRTLACMLNRSSQWQLSLASVEAAQQAGNPPPIQTRFVIDVISGTSAGGINGIFLAKALAGGLPLQQLSRLWTEEADIELLLNDRASHLPGLPSEPSPSSLLNSRRMYRKLLDALNGMSRGQEPDPPCVQELDLYITTTDIEGLPVTMRLADKPVEERRHRKVFHFCYREGTNDFKDEDNPFLAFAARCTSSFPFAFEPMELADIDPFVSHPGKNGSQSSRWKDFFAEYRRAEDQGATLTPYPRRSFGDGGYLDNKPFSYAIDALLERQADVPVDRKLFYIEPTPEHLGTEKLRDRKPNAAENVVAAVLTLPRYETIREDLERVLERNRLIERVLRITRGIEDDVKHGADRKLYVPLSGGDWAKRDLGEMVSSYGIAYGSYHRLKVARATDDLARLVASAAGLDVESDQFLAVQYLVRAWRDTQYITYYGDAGTPDSRESGKLTFNRFLIDFDLDYRVRRLSLVRFKLDILTCLDDDAVAILKAFHSEAGVRAILDQQEPFVDRLLGIKPKLSEAYVLLKQARQGRWSVEEVTSVQSLVRDLKIGSDDLQTILKEPTDRDRLQAACSFLGGERATSFQALADRLGELFRANLEKASRLCKEALGSWETEPPREGAPVDILAVRSLWSYYWSFDTYDLVTFPVLYSVQAGELDTVEVFRISPEDAPSVIDETQSGRRKLAGAAVGHFGGFLDRIWRQNDILWGRLDGAERLITALLPGDAKKAEREKLIRQAHCAIIDEETKPQERGEMMKLLAQAIATDQPAGRNEERLRALLAADPGSAIRTRIEKVLSACLTAEEYLDYLAQDFEVDRSLNSRRTVHSLARASRVVGGMLEGMADQYRIETRRLAWVTRLGQIFWGLVTVATPGSPPELIFRHWLQLLYLFETLLIVGGLAASNKVVQGFGWGALKTTLAVHCTVWLLGDFMSRRPLRWRVARIVAIIAAVALGGILLAEAQRWIPFGLGSLAEGLGAARDAYARRLAGSAVPQGVRLVSAAAVRSAGVLLALVAVLVLVEGGLRKRRGQGGGRSKKKLPGGFREPLLALEFAATPEDVATILKGRQAGLRSALVLDAGFILLYTGLLLVLSRLLAGSGIPAAEWLGLAAGFCGVSGACLDLLENLILGKLLDAGSLGERERLLPDLRMATVGKWTLLSLAFGLLAVFWLGAPFLLAVIGGVCFAVPAVLGITAILLRRWSLLRWMVPLLAFAQLIALSVLIARPDLLPGVLDLR